MISLFLYANSARELHKQRTDSERARSAGWHHRGYADTYRRVPDGTRAAGRCVDLRESECGNEAPNGEGPGNTKIRQ